MLLPHCGNTRYLIHRLLVLTRVTSNKKQLEFNLGSGWGEFFRWKSIRIKLKVNVHRIMILRILLAPWVEVRLEVYKYLILRVINKSHVLANSTGSGILETFLITFPKLPTLLHHPRFTYPKVAILLNHSLQSPPTLILSFSGL